MNHAMLSFVYILQRNSRHNTYILSNHQAFLAFLILWKLPDSRLIQTTRYFIRSIHRFVFPNIMAPTFNIGEFPYSTKSICWLNSFACSKLSKRDLAWPPEGDSLGPWVAIFVLVPCVFVFLLWALWECCRRKRIIQQSMA
ncbi:hypothetical protein F5Y02DRAFT_393611 [Annulohypoxylon stygium]|nr:hypothetical protein F5Y02DRAFT_393611 [Annulohypoxylon stygium]